MAHGFDLLQRADPDTELVPPERIRDEVGSDSFHGGLLYKKSAQMHMGAFGDRACDGGQAERRADFRKRRGFGASARIGRAAADYHVARQHDRGAGAGGDRARACSGPFFYFRRRVIPIGSFIIATEPLSEAQLDFIMPTRRTATTTLNIGNYFRIAPDNRLIFGGRARFALSSPTSDLKSGRILEATLHRVFPQLGPVRIDYCWGGIIDLTADRLPRAGEHEGVFYAMGFSGHGAQMSVHMGQRMAAVMGGDADANPLRGLPWPAVFGHFGPPWFMPFVGAYYRFKDVVG